jgi:hypothetical protein
LALSLLTPIDSSIFRDGADRLCASLDSLDSFAVDSSSSLRTSSESRSSLNSSSYCARFIAGSVIGVTGRGAVFVSPSPSAARTDASSAQPSRASSDSSARAVASSPWPEANRRIRTYSVSARSGLARHNASYARRYVTLGNISSRYT